MLRISQITIRQVTRRKFVWFSGNQTTFFCGCLKIIIKNHVKAKSMPERKIDHYQQLNSLLSCLKHLKNLFQNGNIFNASIINQNLWCASLIEICDWFTVMLHLSLFLSMLFLRWLEMWKKNEIKVVNKLNLFRLEMLEVAM